MSFIDYIVIIVLYTRTVQVVLKLNQAGQGAPGREPQLDSSQQASMMKYWHNRREQMVSALTSVVH